MTSPQRTVESPIPRERWIAALREGRTPYGNLETNVVIVKPGQTVDLLWAFENTEGWGGHLGCWGRVEYVGEPPEFVEDVDVEQGASIYRAKGRFRLYPGSIVSERAGSRMGGGERQVTRDNTYVCGIPELANVSPDIQPQPHNACDDQNVGFLTSLRVIA